MSHSQTHARSATCLACALMMVAGLLSSACGPPPKVLVDQTFFGPQRTAKILMQRSGDEVFDEYIRICDLTEDGEETNCKDTLVLGNVLPGSLY